MSYAVQIALLLQLKHFHFSRHQLLYLGFRFPSVIGTPNSSAYYDRDFDLQWHIPDCSKIPVALFSVLDTGLTVRSLYTTS